jgi:hypothetical protein
MTDEHRDPSVDDLPSEEELAEAAALARALERETLDEAQLDALLPALEAGHLLRMARAPEPTEARLSALYAELEAALPGTPPVVRETGRAAGPTGWRAARAWLLLATSASLAAAVGLWFFSRDAGAPSAVAALPPPTLAVLEAQLGAAQRSTADAADEPGDADAQPLAQAMRPYRAELLAQLATEYAP